ncbi:brachyurin-like [Zophobas morio]|uniref:brachyurin-like n=1 Tax=Zophobas morio TaxID=2755281 RepID=UPI0030828482
MEAAKFVFLLIISSLYYYTNGKVSPRIIGGEVARASQFRFAAAIYTHTADSKFFCGGALTGNQWIITSGTCVYNAELFTIQLGSNTLEGEDSNREVLATSTYYLHPDFNPETLENDIAVIELRMAVMLNGYIQPIYATSMDHQNNTDAISLGFGQVSDSDPELSNELRYVSTVTLTNEECRLYYGNQIVDNMVCASGNYNEGTCIGDNGGPLVITNGKYFSLIGVASFISANGCESTDPSGYTRIRPYADWIHNITGRYG